MTLNLCIDVSSIIYVNGRYHAPVDTPALVRSSTLCQELGQVEYVFSDKTGTLTRNEMKLKAFSLCHSDKEFTVGTASRRAIAAELGASGGVDNTNANAAGSVNGETNDSTDSNDLRMMMTILSVAHTVVIEEDNRHLSGKQTDTGVDSNAPASTTTTATATANVYASSSAKADADERRKHEVVENKKRVGPPSVAVNEDEESGSLPQQECNESGETKAEKGAAQPVDKQRSTAKKVCVLHWLWEF